MFDYNYNDDIRVNEWGVTNMSESSFYLSEEPQQAIINREYFMYESEEEGLSRVPPPPKPNPIGDSALYLLFFSFIYLLYIAMKKKFYIFAGTYEKRGCLYKTRRG